MSELTEIYVYLVGEGLDVWRPVKAEHIARDVYKISEQESCTENESWQFGPGSSVVCRMIEVEDGPIRAAIRNAVEKDLMDSI